MAYFFALLTADAEVRRMSFTRRDFLRAAVFFLITPRLAALSIA